MERIPFDNKGPCPLIKGGHPLLSEKDPCYLDNTGPLLLPKVKAHDLPGCGHVSKNPYQLPSWRYLARHGNPKTQTERGGGKRSCDVCQNTFGTDLPLLLRADRKFSRRHRERRCVHKRPLRVMFCKLSRVL